MKKKPENILVIIGHSYGEIEAPLTTWMEVGPGLRPYTRPIRVIDKETGKSLPLNTIPFRYRNNWASRLFIKWGIIDNPWG